MVARVRVGVPIYNGARWLGHTLQCIQEQSYAGIEVLLSIDGGDTQSLPACEPYLDDRRFRLVQHRDRLGWSGNLNYLMQTAETEFFCYWQHDDFASTNYLERLLAVMDERPDAAIAYTDVQWFGRAFGRESLPSIEGFPRHRVKQYMLEQHWIPLRGLMRGEFLGRVPADFRLHPGSPWENGLLSYLTGLGSLLRVEDAMYFKRSHNAAWSTSFESRPRHQRHKDWLLRGKTLYEVLNEFRGESSSMECLEYTLDRFCAIRQGLFHDSPDPEDRSAARFLRDWVALGGGLPSPPSATGPRPGAEQAPALRAAIMSAIADSTRREEVADQPMSWGLGSTDRNPGQHWLAYGWSHQEPWGVWSDGPVASLWVPPVSRSANLVLHGYHFGSVGAEVDIEWTLVGSTLGGSVHAEPNQPVAIAIPIDHNARRLELHLPHAASPMSMGLSTDERELGFGLTSVAVEV